MVVGGRVRRSGDVVVVVERGPVTTGVNLTDGRQSRRTTLATATSNRATDAAASTTTYRVSANTQGGSGIYASWFSPPSCT